MNTIQQDTTYLGEAVAKDVEVFGVAVNEQSGISNQQQELSHRDLQSGQAANEIRGLIYGAHTVFKDQLYFSETLSAALDDNKEVYLKMLQLGGSQPGVIDSLDFEYFRSISSAVAFVDTPIAQSSIDGTKAQSSIDADKKEQENHTLTLVLASIASFIFVVGAFYFLRHKRREKLENTERQLFREKLRDERRTRRLEVNGGVSVCSQTKTNNSWLEESKDSFRRPVLGRSGLCDHTGSDMVASPSLLKTQVSPDLDLQSLDDSGFAECLPHLREGAPDRLQGSHEANAPHHSSTRRSLHSSESTATAEHRLQDPLEPQRRVNGEPAETISYSRSLRNPKRSQSFSGTETERSQSLPHLRRAPSDPWIRKDSTEADHFGSSENRCSREISTSTRHARNVQPSSTSGGLVPLDGQPTKHVDRKRALPSAESSPDSARLPGCSRSTGCLIPLNSFSDEQRNQHHDDPISASRSVNYSLAHDALLLMLPGTCLPTGGSIPLDSSIDQRTQKHVSNNSPLHTFHCPTNDAQRRRPRSIMSPSKEPVSLSSHVGQRQTQMQVEKRSAGYSIPWNSSRSHGQTEQYVNHNNSSRSVEYLLTRSAPKASPAGERHRADH